MNKTLDINDTGIVHPFANSAISVRSNGDILIQAGDNAGIHIMADSGEVHIYGAKVCVDSNKIVMDGMIIEPRGLSTTEDISVIKSSVKTALYREPLS